MALIDIGSVQRQVSKYPEFALWDDGDAQQQTADIGRIIAHVQERMEKDLHVTYDLKVIKSEPDPGLVQGVDYDLSEDPYDLYLQEFNEYVFLRLRHRPVVSVERIRLMYGGSFKVLQFPIEWLRLDHEQGTLTILPTPGAGWSGMLLQNAGYFVPLLSGGWLRTIVPQMIAVDYTIGGVSPDSTSGTSPYGWSSHSFMAMRLAAREIMIELSDIDKPGLSSVSVGEDGLSQTKTFTRGQGLKYQALINQIEKDYKQFVKDRQGLVAPIMFGAV